MKKCNFKKNSKYDLIVIKVSRTGINIGMSKLCERCVLALDTLPKKIGFKIKNVIYSNSDGSLTKTTPNKLLNQKDHHVTKYYKNNNYKPTLCDCECDHNEDEDEEA